MRMVSSFPVLPAIAATWFLGLFVPLFGGSAVKPGEPVDGSGIVFYPDRWRIGKHSMQLVPWRGSTVVLLTTRDDLDPQTMGRFLERLDAGWKTYTDLTGRSPRLFKQLDGKPTVVAVPSGGLTCGIGCGYLGASGIEVAGFYRSDYPLVASRRNDFPHYYFYEMGRNYYTFGDRHSQFSCGFAVFMRYVCMDAVVCTDPDRTTRKTIEKAEALYAESDMSFVRAFTLRGGLNEKAPRLRRPDGSWIQPSDQPVLYASAMLKLRRDYGGDAWVKRFFRELAKCPPVRVKRLDDALRQSLSWFVAASCAAKRDLSPVFVDRWRLPLGAEARTALKKAEWRSPEATATRVLEKLPEKPFVRAKRAARTAVRS